MKKAIYFKKATREEMKVAKEILSIVVLKNDEIKLDMPHFVAEYCDWDTFCINNASCCLLGFHRLEYSPLRQFSFNDYLRHLGIQEESYFVSFCLSANWPAGDKAHAKKRLEFVASTGYVPCVKFENEYLEDEQWGINEAFYFVNPSNTNLFEGEQGNIDSIYALDTCFDESKPELVGNFEYRKSFINI